MGENKPALKTLSMLLLVVAVLFGIEKKFLVSEIRGETMTNYAGVNWSDQVVLLIDDFEGLKDSIALQKVSFFAYGNAKMSVDNSQIDNNIIASKTCLKIRWDGKDSYGGWGKGVGKNIDLNTATDYFNFRVFIPKNNGEPETIKIMLEEDDNFDGTLQQDKDDSWFYKVTVTPSDKWEFVSIPLKKFSDGNEGGDGQLNITRKGGLHTIIFSFENVEKYTLDYKWYFDFICFTTGTISEQK